MIRTAIFLFTFILPFPFFAQDPIGNERHFVLGSVLDLRSEILGEQRTINVYLPEGYSASDTTRFPIVYLLDGSVDEDFIHVAGLFQFCNFPWVNCAPPSIVIGIATVDRRRDFTFPSSIASEKEKFPTTGGSERFMRFLEEELQPFVEQRFRSNGESMLIGQSLGGLLATEILFKKPELFDRYLIVSPSLWWADGSLLEFDPHALRSSQHPIEIYLAVGKEGLAPSEKPRVMEVDVNLLAEKIRALENGPITLHFDYLPDEDHATIMHQAVYNGLRNFYMKKIDR